MSELLNALKTIEHFKHAPLQLGPDVESTAVPVTELAELRRKAAAYDAGLPRWAVKYNGELIDYPPCDDSEKDALEQLAKLWTEEEAFAYSVVPVRIVEVLE